MFVFIYACYHFMMLEPGKGYSIIKEKYGYYGKDRYDIAMECLKNSTDEFSVTDGFSILNKVKQVVRMAGRSLL